MRSGQDAAQSESGSVQRKELGLRERIVAAAGASVVSAFVVNPLDVVKTRMQAQAAGASAPAAAAAAALVPHNVLLEKFAFTACPDSCPWASPSQAAKAAAKSNPARSQSTLASMRHIARTEGLLQLWRGTDMALLMAVPMVGIYMPLYDYAKGELQPQLGSSLAPLTAGALSRTAAVLCTAPLDLLRTRMQAMLKHTHLQPAVAGAPAAASRTSQWMEIIRHVQAGSGSGTTARVGALWTGVGATLARDVPFSAVYWALLEPVRSFLLPPQADPVKQQAVPIAGLAYRPHASTSLAAAPSSGASQLTQSGQPETGTSRTAGEHGASCSGSAASAGMGDSLLRGPHHTHWASQPHESQIGAKDGQGRRRPQHAVHSQGAQQAEHPAGQHARAAAGSGWADMRAAGLKDRGAIQDMTPAQEEGRPGVRLLLANLVAGAVGGSAAAALTQPLDVVKTRAQLGHHGKSTSVYQALRELAHEGGVRALFTGVTPRALKAAPACAIVLASYETLKAVYADS